MSFHHKLHLLHNQQNSKLNRKFQRAQQGHQAKSAHQELLHKHNSNVNRNHL